LAVIRSVGLDLAGSPARTTGFCLLRGPRSTTTLPLHSDEEIVGTTLASRPAIVSIDAPLSLPRGRRSLEVRGPPHFRECDRELRRLGIPFFPISLGPMRMLTARGIRLRQRFEHEGLPVIESYPGGAQDVLGLPRKGVGVPVLRRALIGQGFTGDVARPGITHDELDAVSCAAVGREYVQGKAWVLGDPTEGTIILPARERAAPAFLARLARLEAHRRV
jgi:uncharacterized protein